MIGSVVDPDLDAAYEQWLAEKKEQEAAGAPHDEAAEFIGEMIDYKGGKVRVIDAYNWKGETILVLPDNTEINLEDVTLSMQVAEDQKAS